MPPMSLPYLAQRRLPLLLLAALTSGALAGNPLVPGIGCAEPAHLYLVLASHGTKKAATFMQHVV